MGTTVRPNRTSQSATRKRGKDEMDVVEESSLYKVRTKM